MSLTTLESRNYALLGKSSFNFWNKFKILHLICIVFILCWLKRYSDALVVVVVAEKKNRETEDIFHSSCFQSYCFVEGYSFLLLSLLIDVCCSLNNGPPKEGHKIFPKPVNLLYFMARKMQMLLILGY